MRYRSITSILPLLKMRSGNPTIDQWKPEMAQMVGMVERNLGLSKKALHLRQVINSEVINGTVDLPTDFFEEQEVMDFCMPQSVCDMSCCTCNCIPCNCGYWFWQQQTGDFSFGDTILRCPFKSGNVSFSYWGLEMDADGFPMVLEGHVEAFSAYVLSILKLGEMNAGQLNPQIYRINSDNWKEQSLITRSRDNVASRKSVAISAYQIRNKFRFI